MSSYKPEMLRFLKNHPELFEETVELAIADKQPYSWRAALILVDCVKKKDSRLQPYIKKIVKSLPDKKDGHQSSLIKILLQVDVEEDYEGKLFDICIGIWESIDKIPSVRINALRLILNMVRKYPELSGEITQLIRDENMETLSPGAKRCAIKLREKIIQT
jgi:hypothetical protein